MVLQEGKESAIERALGLPVGSIDGVRNGRITIEQALGGDRLPAAAAPQRGLASLAAELEYFRNLLGAEDFHRMMTLANAMYHERRKREESSVDGAESDPLEDAS